MAFIVEKNVTPNPVHISLLGAIGVVFVAQGVAELVEEFSRLRRRCPRRGRCRFFGHFVLLFLEELLYLSMVYFTRPEIKFGGPKCPIIMSLWSGNL